jgi:hypothetical protein
MFGNCAASFVKTKTKTKTKQNTAAQPVKSQLLSP